jgi:hypothetical protein
VTSVNGPNRSNQLISITTEIKKEGIETHINYVDNAGNEHTVTYDIELNNFGYSNEQLAALTAMGEDGDHKAQLVAIANSVSAKFHATINQYSQSNELDGFFEQKDISISSKHLDSSSTTALTYQFGITALSSEYTIDSRWQEQINDVKQYMLGNSVFIAKQALLLSAYKKAAQNDVSEDASKRLARFKAELNSEQKKRAMSIYEALRNNNVVFKSTYQINQENVASEISAHRRDHMAIGSGSHTLAETLGVLDVPPSRAPLDAKTKKRYERGVRTLDEKIYQLRYSRMNVIKKLNKKIENETDSVKSTHLKTKHKRMKELQKHNNRLADQLEEQRRELQQKLDNS